MSKEYLYSPWRFKYIQAEKENKCIFCESIKSENISDDLSLLVYKTKLSFVIMNLYPYNNGHLMVVPKKHVSSLSALSIEELTDLSVLVQRTEVIIKKVFNSDGINVGINLGKAAGAGIDEHLHIHMVPRWFGDSNFMTTVSNVRVIPQSFEEVVSKLKQEFNNEK
ncbi:MAG: HIT domain-containing protein [Candidatus Cloacimonetes bacterium]|jgi:ATP adenylyltransferase|nr:HIT domain-containing protein [Candidatus Cloacimonadota bacterium]